MDWIIIIYFCGFVASIFVAGIFLYNLLPLFEDTTPSYEKFKKDRDEHNPLKIKNSPVSFYLLAYSNRLISVKEISDYTGLQITSVCGVIDVLRKECVVIYVEVATEKGNNKRCVKVIDEERLWEIVYGE